MEIKRYWFYTEVCMRDFVQEAPMYALTVMDYGKDESSEMRQYYVDVIKGGLYNDD